MSADTAVMAPYNKPFHLTPASLPVIARAAAGERQRSANKHAAGCREIMP